MVFSPQNSTPWNSFSRRLWGGLAALAVAAVMLVHHEIDATEGGQPVTLYVGDNHGVGVRDGDTGSTLAAAWPMEEVRALAVDGTRGRVWVWHDNLLSLHDLAGVQLAATVVPGGDVGDEEGHARLAVDEESGQGWLGVGTMLHRFDVQATLLGSTAFTYPIRGLAMDNTHHRLWVATHKELVALDAQGNRLTVLSESRQSLLKAIFYHAANDRLWSLWDNPARIKRYTGSGQPVAEIALGKVQGMRLLFGDGQGGGWLQLAGRMVHYGADGRSVGQFDLPRTFGWARDLVMNPRDHSLWLADNNTLLHLTGNGVVGQSIAGQGGHHGLRALAIYADTTPP